MSAIKRTMEVSIEVMKVLKRELSNMLISQLLRENFTACGLNINAPTAIDSRNCVEFYDGKESPFDWDDAPFFFDGFNIVDTIQYLQSNNTCFARCLRQRVIVVLDEMDNVTIIHFDEDGVCRTPCERYEDRFLDAVHELE